MFDLEVGGTHASAPQAARPLTAAAPVAVTQQGFTAVNLSAFNGNGVVGALPVKAPVSAEAGMLFQDRFATTSDFAQSRAVAEERVASTGSEPTFRSLFARADDAASSSGGPIPTADGLAVPDHMGGGDNVLIGGEGDDMQIGGEGKDILIGGFGTSAHNTGDVAAESGAMDVFGMAIDSFLNGD